MKYYFLPLTVEELNDLIECLERDESQYFSTFKLRRYDHMIRKIEILLAREKRKDD